MKTAETQEELGAKTHKLLREFRKKNPHLWVILEGTDRAWSYAHGKYNDLNAAQRSHLKKSCILQVMGALNIGDEDAAEYLLDEAKRLGQNTPYTHFHQQVWGW